MKSLLLFGVAAGALILLAASWWAAIAVVAVGTPIVLWATR